LTLRRGEAPDGRFPVRGIDRATPIGTAIGHREALNTSIRPRIEDDGGEAIQTDTVEGTRRLEKPRQHLLVGGRRTR